MDRLQAKQAFPRRHRRKNSSHIFYSRDLQKWIPSLIRTWRQATRTPGPKDRLLPSEVRLLSDSLRVLSTGLTRSRHLAGTKYFKDPSLLGAYLLYFWPISYIQARYALGTLHTKPKHVLELGAGAGPLGAACQDMGAPHITMADRTPGILRLAKQVSLNNQMPPLLKTWNPYQPQSRLQGKFDLIALQHVLNELWIKYPQQLAKICHLLLDLSEHLSRTGFLLLIEPALTSTSRMLLQVRDRLIQQGWLVTSPCLHQLPCPALDKDTDSCHLNLYWSAPEPVRTLAKAAGLKRKELKMTYFLLRPPNNTPSPSHYQEAFLIVSDPLVSKNKRIRFLGCGPAGRIGIALNPKHANQYNNIFFKLKRGDVIQIKNPEKTQQGIRILPTSKIKILKNI